MSKDFFATGLADLQLSSAPDELDEEDVDSDGVVDMTARATRDTPGTVDTGETLFASPRSQLSVGSSVGGSKDKVKLFFVNNSQDYCCGLIGSGGSNRACVKAAKDCTIAKHQGNKNKLTLEDNTIYIAAGRNKNAVLVTPAVHRSMCSEDVWTYLNTAEQPVEVWRAELEAIIGQKERIRTNVLRVSTSLDGEEASQWTDVELITPGSGQVQAAANSLATPSGADLSFAFERIEGSVVEREEDAIDALNDTFEDIEDIPYKDEEKLLPDEPKASGVILSEWHSVVSNFKYLVNQVKLLKEGHAAHKEGLMYGFTEMNEKIKQVDTKAHLLSSKIGDDPEMSGDGNKTVWQAIKELADEVSTVMHMGTDIQTDWVAKHDRLVDGVSEFRDSFVKAVTNIYGELRSTNTAVSKLTKSVRQTEKNAGLSGSPSSRSFNLLDDQLRFLRGRVDAVESLVRTSRSLSAAKSPTPTTSTTSVTEMESLRAKGSKWWEDDPDYADLPDLISSIKKIDTEVEYLKRKMVDVEHTASRDKGKPYVVGWYTFSSPADLDPLLNYESTSKKFDVGWFWDLFSALENMSSKTQGGKEYADEKHSADRTKTTINTNDMMSKMDHELPHVLFSAKKDSEPSKERELLACPTHAKWLGDGRNSFQTWVDEKLQKFVKQIYQVLPEDDSKAARIAELLCDNITKQWDKISLFVDKTHKQLVTVAGFSEKATWSLIGRYLGAIFTDMAQFRNEVARLDTTDRSNQVRILWAVLQCHRVVDEYIALDFNSHPSIVAEIGVFMLTERVDPSRIASLENKVDDLVDTVKELQKDNKRLFSEMEGLKASAKTDRQNWKNELGQVAKKIKT